MKNLTVRAVATIKEIHGLSRKVNSKGKDHAKVLIGFLKEHAREIEQLEREQDPHLVTETGDMIILCLELLLEKEASPDEVIEACYSRFREKLEEKNATG